MSDDPSPINRRSITTPHSLSEQEGMEGSTGNFYVPVCSVLPQGNRTKEAEHGEVERPMTVNSQSREAMITMARRGSLGRGGNDEPAEAGPHTPGPLPRIQRTEKKGNCCTCNRGTHLLWTSHGFDYRLCQSCAKRKGDIYLPAITNFLSKAIHV